MAPTIKQKQLPPWADPVRWQSNNFDALRLLLAASVIFSHCFPISQGKFHYDFVGDITGTYDIGFLAVNGFFAISGFLIAGSWEKSRSWRSFLWKRCARIFPGYLAMCGVMAILAPLYVDHFQWTVSTLVNLSVRAVSMLDLFSGYACFTHNILPNIANGALWTIPYELRAYLLFPALALLGLQKRRWVPAVLLVASILVLMFMPKLDIHEPLFLSRLTLDPATWPRLATCFIAGFAFYAYRDRIQRRIKFALLCILALAICCWNQGRIAQVNIFGPVSALAITYLIFWLAYLRCGLTRFGEFGDFSYGVYLSGFFIQQLIMSRQPGLSPLGLFCQALPLALATGVASWFLVERHFLSPRRKRDLIEMHTANS